MALADLVRLVRVEAPRADADAVGRALQVAWADAREAHPTVGVDGEAFARHLLRHHGADAAAIAVARGSDLYLALGCGLGDPAALDRLQRDHFSEVPAFVAHVGLSPSALADFLQDLRVRLLTPRSGHAKILDFSGRGPLGGWLRVSAVRLALTLGAKESSHRGDSNEIVAAAASEHDPELLLARLHVRKAFKSAFEASIASIDREERTVLRMHFVDGLTIDEIGRAYGVHRATAARWLASGREKIASLTRKHLRRSLKLERESDLDTMLRLVDSQLDLSLGRVLEDTSTRQGSTSSGGDV